jgi:hypothetical protein
MRREFAAFFCWFVMTAAAAAGQDRLVDLSTRAESAQRVVLASVSDVRSALEVNAYGDQVIVSHFQLQVQETLKGPVVNTIALAMEGGTVNGLTMRVSDLPTMEVGERAVFFVDSAPSGEFRSHGRGLGILKLDSSNRIAGSSLALDDVRGIVRRAAVRGQR